MGYLRYLSKKFGKPPGAVDYVGETCNTEPAVITVTEYFNDDVFEYQVQDIRAFIAKINPEKTYWIRITGLCDTKYIEELGASFGIDSLILEDIVNTMHLPKIQQTGESVFSIQKVIAVDATLEELNISHLATFLRGNIVLTFSDHPVLEFIPFNNRLARNKMKNKKKNAEFLFYIINDLAIDSYFSLIDSVNEKIDIIDEELTSSNVSGIGEHINAFNKLLINAKRNLRPLRAFSKDIREEELDFITSEMAPYFLDMADHIDHILSEFDTHESYLLNIQQKYTNILSVRTNEIMKTMTIYASIFIPLTFLAGVYGMNFRYFPELEWKYGYLVFWAVCGIVSVGMYLYFRFKKWNR